jgi:hypothetical protein
MDHIFWDKTLKIITPFIQNKNNYSDLVNLSPWYQSRLVLIFWSKTFQDQDEIFQLARSE